MQCMVGPQLFYKAGTRVPANKFSKSELVRLLDAGIIAPVVEERKVLTTELKPKVKRGRPKNAV